jgi:hypothetical protein
MGEQVGDLVRTETEVDRNQDHTESCGGEVQHGVVPAVASDDDESVTLVQAAFGQRHGAPVNRRIEIRVGQLYVTVDDRCLRGDTQCGAPEQISNGVLTN